MFLFVWCDVCIENFLNRKKVLILNHVYNCFSFVYLYKYIYKKKSYLTKIIVKILVNVERFSVYRMQDFLLYEMCYCPCSLVYFKCKTAGLAPVSLNRMILKNMCVCKCRATLFA